MKGLAAVECARCRTAHCEAFALGDGAATRRDDYDTGWGFVLARYEARTGS